MKEIKVETTGIKESQIKFRGDESKILNYIDLIEIALDIIPQGGFTPKDIRDRNRIQDALDKAKSVEDSILLEDADFEALEKVIKDSRWTLRDRDLNIFLKKFEDGVYKEKETKKSKKETPKE